MFSILGMELFAFKSKFDFDNKPIGYFNETAGEVSKIRSVPDSNFDSLMNATVSVFIVLANDGWSTIYLDYYRTAGPFSSSIFFILLLLLGQMIMLNLMLSILLKEFDESNLQ